MKEYTLITGASSGIGFHTALSFAKKGSNIIITARRNEELQQLKEKINKIDAQIDVMTISLDLSAKKAPYELYDMIKEYNITTVINNAGFGNYDEVKIHDLNKITKMINLNITSLTVLSTLFVRDNFDKELQLINVASVGGYNVFENAVTYSATKYYVSSFTEGLDLELRRTGSKMRAKTLAPAAVQTEFAKVALDMTEFDYNNAVAKFHTPSQMADFVLLLHKSDKSVGIVNRDTYEFELKESIHSHV